MFSKSVGTFVILILVLAAVTPSYSFAWGHHGPIATTVRVAGRVAGRTAVGATRVVGRTAIGAGRIAVGAVHGVGIGIGATARWFHHNRPVRRGLAFVGWGLFGRPCYY